MKPSEFERVAGLPNLAECARTTPSISENMGIGRFQSGPGIGKFGSLYDYEIHPDVEQVCQLRAMLKSRRGAVKYHHANCNSSFLMPLRTLHGSRRQACKQWMGPDSCPGGMRILGHHQTTLRSKPGPGNCLVLIV